MAPSICKCNQVGKAQFDGIVARVKISAMSLKVDPDPIKEMNK